MRMICIIQSDRPLRVYIHPKILCKVMSLKSRIKTYSFLEEIIISNTDVFKDVESDIAVGIGELGNPTRITAERNNKAKHTAGS